MWCRAHLRFKPGPNHLAYLYLYYHIVHQPTRFALHCALYVCACPFVTGPCMCVRSCCLWLRI